MTDALLDVKKEMEKSVTRLEDRISSLTSFATPSNEEKRSKKKAISQLNKTRRQLDQLTALLSREKRQLQSIDTTDVTSQFILSHNCASESSTAISSPQTQELLFPRVVKDSIIRNILILVAMEQEARPFLERHRLQENVPSPFESGSPMISYSGNVVTATGGEVTLHLIWNGRCKVHSCNLVATTAAGVATYAAVQVFRPDLVISAGTAGGFSELGARIGDVYLSTKCIFHARRIPICLPAQQSAGRFREKHFEEYGFGHFRSPPLNGLARTIGVKQGIVSSSDCLDCSEIDLQLLRSEGAVVKEMEAAAVAWVCQVLGTPFFALKSITDIVDGPLNSEEEFYSNLMLASDSLQQKLTLAVQHLGGTVLESASPPPKQLEGGGGGGKEKSHAPSMPLPKECDSVSATRKDRGSSYSKGDDVSGHASEEELTASDSYTLSIPKGLFQAVSFALVVVGACVSWYATSHKSNRVLK